MATHVRVVGVLHIVLGALGVIAAIVLMGVFGGIAGIVGASGEPDAQVAVPILGALGGVIGLIVLLFSIPGILAGIGVLQYREWARILMIVISAFNLLNIPFGTALGVYALWALLHRETVALFRDSARRAVA